uniref:Zn(2)-C6 fungal-type domain-containing protein n=1 Tax=Moniliophthora roreri TaxID=221103 RepID=A0A0W0EU27_MONRR
MNQSTIPDWNGHGTFRTLVACTNCRRRKSKCKPHPEGVSRPCERCYNRRLSCEYPPVDSRSSSTSTPTSIQIAVPAPPLSSLGFHALSEPNRHHQSQHTTVVQHQTLAPLDRTSGVGHRPHFGHTGGHTTHTSIASISIPPHSYPPPTHYIPETSPPWSQHHPTFDYSAGTQMFNVGGPAEGSAQASTLLDFIPSDITSATAPGFHSSRQYHTVYASLESQEALPRIDEYPNWTRGYVAGDTHIIDHPREKVGMYSGEMSSEMLSKVQDGSTNVKIAGNESNCVCLAVPPSRHTPAILPQVLKAIRVGDNAEVLIPTLPW